jgi:hypothetical protein
VREHDDVAHRPARVEQHTRRGEPSTLLVVVAPKLHLDHHPRTALALGDQHEVGTHLQRVGDA